ncbi:hypothetical protein [Aeromonas salmonicida]|uniref:hypothetical protein n=1 Tax=Aeromonas salmonicida TaxID=645 RepID=UPI0022404EA9|nr:hypothetical protein [Aeromonas salmonicida]
MSYYARVVGGIAVEVWDDGGLGIAPRDVHVQALSEQFIPCPAGTLPGAYYDGSSWNNPDVPEPSTPLLIPVIISEVNGDEKGFDNAVNEYTVRLGSQLVISGPLPVPDQRFRVPCRLRDTGRTVAAVADVVAGQVTISVTLPELGYWETTEAMINDGLPQQTFSLPNPIVFVVI